jgi:hypothetical protein
MSFKSTKTILETFKNEFKITDVILLLEPTYRLFPKVIPSLQVTANIDGTEPIIFI